MAKKISKAAKEQAKGILSNWIVRNLLLAAALIAGLLLVAQVALGIITRHGKTVTVPDFTNMTVAEAADAARDAHVGVKVTDSVFVRRLGAGVIYRQSPKAGSTVKKGRSIFLTINSIVPRKVVMPNLVGYSLNEARSELNNRGLSLGRLNYTQDIATNNVLRQTVRISLEHLALPAGHIPARRIEVQRLPVHRIAVVGDAQMPHAGVILRHDHVEIRCGGVAGDLGMNVIVDQKGHVSENHLRKNEV